MRLAKWRSRSRSFAGQCGFGQRSATSPSERTVRSPQIGQVSGNRYATVSAGRRSRTTFTTLGITSPARSTNTVSPTRTSSRSISSWLCSVACSTVTPPMRTGSSTATGVSVPVRPTDASMPITRVVSWRGGNLNAIAQRGERFSVPRRFCSAKSSTLTTVPSTS